MNLNLDLPHLNGPDLALSLPTACIHCGNPVPKMNLSRFCCHGCEAVFQWIQNHELGKFYDLKMKSDPLRRSTPVSDKNEDFDFLDEADFLDLYSWVTPDGRWMEFYLEGVHCAACVWLTEKLPEFIENVSFVRLNLGNSVVTVRLNPEGKFAPAAAEFQKMGFRCHPVKRGERSPVQQKENRLWLIRIGVAGACAGNIMLLAVSLYGGATGDLAVRFRWLSFVIFLPVIFFSAVPFYESAWNSIKSKEVSIDIPVVFGLLLGSIASFFNLIQGDERVYFDSLTALIFLLLSTRFLIKCTQQKAFNASRLLHFITPSSVKKWNPQTESQREVRLDQISVGDQVQVLPGECIPVDGIILKGKSFLDCALLSGESSPAPANQGDLVFAGTFNLDAPIIISVTQSGSKSRVGRILESVENLVTKKAPITVFADRVSRYFIFAVVTFSAIALLSGFIDNWHHALNRALAVAIVTCPCTFALITPLALNMTLGRLAQLGILVKGPEILEKLTQIKSVFLDKTGTLTFGTPDVTLWDVPQEISAEILAIESQSIHPTAKALVKYLSSHANLGATLNKLPQVDELHETLGQGIRGKIGANWIEIRRSIHQEFAFSISVYKNDVEIGRIQLADQARPESQKIIEQFHSIHLDPWILSGDHSIPVYELGKKIGIQQNHCISEASPEKKAQVIRTSESALMVGDGANDAIALAQAYVGVAAHSGVEISLKAADIYLNRPGIRPLFNLIVIAKETLKVLKRNFWLSIIYNSIAGGFALAGKIDPLLAAILMPMSALTVFVSSLIGTQKLRKAFKEIYV